MTQTALILGASGHFGRHAAEAFAQAGWTVRRFDRRRDVIERAARGADLIVNAMNPAGYRDWDRLLPGITETAIKAGRASGAPVLVPGNVYNFGRALAPWSETTPQHPVTGKGRVRVAIENRYREATEREGLRVIVLRGGDFLDTTHAMTWAGMILQSAGKGSIRYPGNPDIPHAWAWLPDMARAAVALAEMRDELPAFADIAFPGYRLTGQELAALAAAALGREVSAGRFAWWPLRLLAPFWQTARGLIEMRYLWDHPHWLEGSEFHRLLPDFRPTPAGEAIAAILRAQGRAISTQTSRWSEEVLTPPATSS